MIAKQNLHRDWVRGPLRGLEFFIGQVNAALLSYKQILHSDCHKAGTGHHLCQCLSKNGSSKGLILRGQASLSDTRRDMLQFWFIPGLYILGFYFIT
jgi:hypothetical protein